ncbi:MAG: hypothetical protein QJR00_06580, partial [Bacillota bacterium]|nr:hypothetical protein [Bacillota bacterium]
SSGSSGGRSCVAPRRGTAEGEGPFAQELAESLHRLLDLAGALPGEGELPALRLTLVEGASPGRVEGWYSGMPFARSWLTVFRALRHAQAPLQRRELHWDLKGTFRLFRRQTPVRFRIEVSEEGSLLSWLSSLYGLLLSALGRSYPQKDLDTFVAKGLGAAMATAPTRAREGLGGGVSAAFPSVHVFQRRPGEREIPPLMRTPNKRTGWQPPA